MSSTEPRVQAVSAVSNPAILGNTGTIRSTEPRNTSSIEYRNTASTPVTPTESNMLQLPLVGPSLNVSQMRCTPSTESIRVLAA